jgi:hypothetical protein
MCRVSLCLDEWQIIEAKARGLNVSVEYDGLVFVIYSVEGEVHTVGEFIREVA